MCNSLHSLRLGQEALAGSRSFDPGSVARVPVDEDAPAGAAPDARTTDDDALLATVGEVRRDG
jgi:hypothetical protein